MALSAEELRARVDGAQDLPREPVAVPEWGITEDDGLFMRGLTGSELDAYQASMRKFRGNTQVITLNDMRARLVGSCLVDSNGQRLYSDKDVKALGEKSGKVLDRLFDHAARISGLTEEAVEELVENFGNGPSDGDGSG